MRRWDGGKVRQNSEVGSLKWEVGMRKSEKKEDEKVGRLDRMRKWECGRRKRKKMRRLEG